MSRVWKTVRGSEPVLVGFLLFAWLVRNTVSGGWGVLFEGATLVGLAVLAAIWCARLVHWGRLFLRAPRAIARTALSVLLTFVSPPVLLFSLAQVTGEVLVRFRYRGRLPAPETYRQRVRYRLPITGCWTVYNGGITPETSHSWQLADQRYAYDLLVTDDEGRNSRVDPPRRPEDCYAWGRPVVAPADGVVVAVRDGHRDCPWVGMVDPFAWDPLGNMVVIRHAEGEYSLLAHLQRGSVCVRPGERVEAGQVVGRCGNSGHSTEPHLHVQIQDRPRFLLAASLPVQFDDWWRLGPDGRRAFVSRGYLCRGDVACAGVWAETTPGATGGAGVLRADPDAPRARAVTPEGT